MSEARFEWDSKKDKSNQKKHDIAFSDPKRVIAGDVSHSQEEKRYYCFGLVEGNVVTVRFTYRAGVIRIIGAGYWRQGKKIYEKENKIHR